MYFKKSAYFIGRFFQQKYSRLKHMSKRVYEKVNFQRFVVLNNFVFVALTFSQFHYGNKFNIRKVSILQIAAL